MNKIILLGNLTKEPEIRTTSTGLKTASFSLAINDGKDKEGKDQVQYFNCSAFDKTAQIFEKFVRKGHKVMVVGRLKNESWDKPDGTKGTGVKITVSEVEMLTSKMQAETISRTYNNDLPSVENIVADLDIPLPEISNYKNIMPF